MRWHVHLHGHAEMKQWVRGNRGVRSLVWGLGTSGLQYGGHGRWWVNFLPIFTPYDNRAAARAGHESDR